MVQVRVNRKSGRVDPQKNMGQVTGQPVFAFFFKKIRFGLGIFRVGSENCNPFCHV